MQRIDLPGGNWADILDADEIKVRQRKLIRSAAFSAVGAIGKLPENLPSDPEEIAKLDLSNMGLSLDEATSLETLQEATVVAFLHGWSYPEPLPTMQTVGDMDLEIFDAIATATQGSGAQLVQESAEIAPSPVETPGNPTGSSETSAGHSSVTEAQSISTQPSDIKNTSSEL